jgi:hypothetical protein
MYGQPKEKWYELKTKEFSREFRKHNEWDKKDPIHHEYIKRINVRDLY